MTTVCEPLTYLRPTGEHEAAADGAIMELVRVDAGGTATVARLDAATCRDWLRLIATSLWVWADEGLVDGTQQLAYGEGSATERPRVVIPAGIAHKWAADLALALWHHAPRPTRARGRQ